MFGLTAHCRLLFIFVYGFQVVLFFVNIDRYFLSIAFTDKLVLHRNYIMLCI